MSIAIVELRGSLIEPSAVSASSLADAAQHEPSNGVYLVARTWHGGKTLELDAHFDRMESSAVRLGHTIVVPRMSVRRALDDLRLRAAHTDGQHDIRFRVTAVLDAVPWYRIAVEPARESDPQVWASGVDCEIADGAARANATVKSTAWMHERTRLGGSATPYEWLLTDDGGYILEGATSNVWCVRDGALWTASEGVLEGIARRIVLQVAERIIPVRLEPVPESELESVSEVFITSATRGVVPVRSIGGQRFVAPGPVTTVVGERYEQWLTEHLEPLVGSSR